jgi:hypothetical protein
LFGHFFDLFAQDVRVARPGYAVELVAATPFED